MTFLIKKFSPTILIISVISLVVSLYLIEGYLTFKEQLSKEQLSKAQLSKERLYKKQTGNNWDKRTKLAIYKDLKKTNNGIVVTVIPNNYIKKNHSIFVLSGISNSQTISCNENGYYSIYQSDRYGFNNPDNEWDEQEIEYLLIGDSFTHGACVNRPNDISSVLRKKSNKSVLNLGMYRNGPLIEYVTLREYLEKNVKKVLWIYFEGNDLRDLAYEKTNNILINYLKDLNFTQNLKLKHNEINKLIEDTLDVEISKNYTVTREEQRKKDQKIKYKILKFIRLDKTKKVFTNYQIKQELAKQIFEVSELQETLKLAKELVEKNNSKLYFVYLPEYSRYKINYDNTNYNLVKNIVTELKIPFIDIHKEVFEKEKNPLKLFPFELYGHYNIEGYKKVAQTIYKLTKD